MNDILRHPILFLLIVAAGFLFIISWALSYHKLRQRGYRSTWIALFIATSCLVGIAAAFAISLACDRIFLVRKLGLSDSNTVFFVQFTISALALLLTAAAILYLLNRILPIRTNRRERGGFRNGWLWFARTLISIGVLLLLFSLALSVRNFHLTEFDKDYRHVVLMSIFGTVYILLGWWYLQRARVSRNIDEVLKSDARPPVLFLRAFKDETRFFDFAYAGQRKSRSLPHLADRGYLNLDLYLSDAIEKLIGPFIALGNPDDVFAPAGAARSYAASEDWRETFKKLAAKCAAILVLPGNTGELAWELSWLLVSGNAAKVFLLFGRWAYGFPENPIDRFLKTSPKPLVWSEYRCAIDALGYQLPATAPNCGRVINFTAKGEAHLIDKSCRSPEDYAAAILSRLNL
jgi:hypothetical protein